MSSNSRSAILIATASLVIVLVLLRFGVRTVDQEAAMRIEGGGGQFEIRKNGFTIFRRLLGRQIGCHTLGPADQVTSITVGRMGGATSPPSLPVDDSWIRATVGDLERLVYLSLDDTYITEFGLFSICSFDIKTLSLRNTATTDKGVSNIVRIDGIENLYLDETMITDDGLDELSTVTSLKRLSVCGTKVSEAAAMRFRQRNPTCLLDCDYFQR